MKIKLILIILLSLTGFACKKSEKTSDSSKINISIWESEDTVVLPYLDKIITDFEAANPGVKVSRTHYAVEDLHTQFQSASIAGSPPELLLTASDKAGLFVSSGLIMPLDNLFDFNVYLDNAMEAVIQDGKIWGVPNSYGNQLMLYYNTDYLKSAPKNTRELFKICDRVIKNTNKTNPNRKMTCFEINQSEPFWLMPVLTSFGGWPMQGQKPTLNTEAMVKSLEFIKDLKTKNYISKECDYNCLDSMFKEGNTAMIVNGDWTLGAYIDSMKGKMKIAVLPINSETGLRMKPMVSGKYFFVSSFTKANKIDAIKKLIKAFNSVENQRKMKDELKKLPSLKKVFESSNIKSDPLFSVMAKQIEHGEAMPSVVEMRAVWDIVRQYQGLVLSDKMDADTAARRMQEEVIKRINEMKM
jgi:arabinogalactan oligomer / maltooligosaccharide transport system substrate-binding protein